MSNLLFRIDQFAENGKVKFVFAVREVEKRLKFIFFTLPNIKTNKPVVIGFFIRGSQEFQPPSPLPLFPF